MLTDAKIRGLKPNENNCVQKITDRGGLFIALYPTGTKTFKWNYRWLGRQKTITIGQYPAFSLEEARQIASGLRITLQRGQEPSIARIQGHGATGKKLQEYIDDVIALSKKNGKANTTIAKYHWVKKAIPRALLNMPISQIKPNHLAGPIKEIVDTGHYDKARKTCGLLRQAARLALVEGHIAVNPADHLSALVPAAKHEHHPAITDLEELSRLMVKTSTWHGSRSISAALQLQPHVFLRPGELRASRWAEIDLEANVWVIPAKRMKMSRDHLVPLSPAASRILTAHREFTDSELIFPSMSNPTKPISENGLNRALWRMGYKGKMTAHGYRTTASTLLNEMGWNWDWIETQLSHESNGSVRGAYNRAQYLTGRIQMMQCWSDFIDQLVAFGRHASSTLPRLSDFGPVRVEQ